MRSVVQCHALPTCEQQCGRPATVYAIDPIPGGWGGRYCEPCAQSLKFQVTDHYVLHKWVCVDEPEKIASDPTDLPWDEWVCMGENCERPVGYHLTGDDSGHWHEFYQPEDGGMRLCSDCAPGPDVVFCSLCELDSLDNGTPLAVEMRSECHYFIAHEPHPVLHTLCRDCASKAEENWVFTVSDAELKDIHSKRVSQGLPELTDMEIVQHLTDEFE